MEATLKDSKTEILRTIERLTITSAHIPTYHWDNASRHRLRQALEIKIVTEEEIKELLVRKLKATGRTCFERNWKYGEFLDNPCGLAEVFAFALQHGEFSEEEKNAIRFDHGDTVSSFIRLYYDAEFIEKIFRQLIAEAQDFPSNLSVCTCHDLC